MPVITERACEYCGQMFTPQTARGRYCRDSHRALASRQRNATQRNNGVPVAQLATVSPIRSGPAAAWNPARGHRRAYMTDEPCPDCGAALAGTPGGTRRLCLTCRHYVIPAGVAAPYQRGQDAPQRQVSSPRESDREDLNLAGRKDQMLRRVARSGLPAGSVVAEQLTSKIRAAASVHRLGELDELLDWALGAPGDAGDGEIIEGEIVEEADADSEAVYVYDSAGRLVLAEATDDGRLVPAAPRLAIAAAPVSPPSTWAAALAAIGGRIVPGGDGCEIATGSGPPCGAVATRQVSGTSACEQHHYQLVSVLIGRPA